VDYIEEYIYLLTRYTMDTTGKEITREEILALPYHRAIYGKWLAKAYYREGMYQRVEDIPDGIDQAYIVDDEGMAVFRRIDGEWKEWEGTRTKRSEMKGQYGSVWPGLGR
jgi:hypothetical protein